MFRLDVRELRLIERHELNDERVAVGSQRGFESGTGVDCSANASLVVSGKRILLPLLVGYRKHPPISAFHNALMAINADDYTI
jgi:hypothetical protein